ncbi:Splicing factor 3B subunit 4 [Quaeritorhiza haematococci]|nr:Splicing factor 3B subunit 4 [Quaeritorhiza haematococci]
MQRTEERNQDATVYVGNLDERVTDALLWELMLQAGPVVNVHLPKDRVTQLHQGYAFCEYMSEEDADYAIKVMNMIKLYGKPIRVNKATSDKKNLDIGATLFIGNLDPDVDEKLLYDTFSAFGVIVQTPKVARDPDVGNSKGYGFISFDNFDSSDAAIEAMNGQYLMNKPITVSYAFKKDGKGERHGSAAERLLAAQARKNTPVQLPNRLFANINAGAAGAVPARPPMVPTPGAGPMGVPARPPIPMAGNPNMIPIGQRPPPAPMQMVPPMGGAPGMPPRPFMPPPRPPMPMGAPGAPYGGYPPGPPAMNQYPPQMRPPPQGYPGSNQYQYGWGQS